MLLLSLNDVNTWMESLFYYSKNRRMYLLRIFKTLKTSLLQAYFGYGRIRGEVFGHFFACWSSCYP